MKYVPPAEVELAARGWFASVDPGINYPAAAVWRDGRLVAARRVPVPGKLAEIEDTGERSRQVAERIAAYVLAVTAGARPAYIAIEWPFVRPGEFSKNPNDLIALSAIGLATATYLGSRVMAPLPHMWIGSIPKAKSGDPWKSPRGHLIRSRLTEAEIAVVVASHDSIDSVGIGMARLGRLGKLYPGTR